MANQKSPGPACSGKHKWQKLAEGNTSTVIRFRCSKCKWYGYRQARAVKIRPYKNGVLPTIKDRVPTVFPRGNDYLGHGPDEFDPLEPDDDDILD